VPAAFRFLFQKDKGGAAIVVIWLTIVDNNFKSSQFFVFHQSRQEAGHRAVPYGWQAIVKEGHGLLVMYGFCAVVTTISRTLLYCCCCFVPTSTSSSS
jgi:hypothetical protein